MDKARKSAQNQIENFHNFLSTGCGLCGFFFLMHAQRWNLSDHFPSSGQEKKAQEANQLMMGLSGAFIKAEKGKPDVEKGFFIHIFS